jgi:enediyne biosynthesis protein E3
VPGRSTYGRPGARQSRLRIGAGLKIVNYSAGRLRKFIFGISPEEASFRRRGFRCRDERARVRLEGIGATFLRGYHAALEAEGDEVLVKRLDAVESELRGFAFEGAAMGLALLDFLNPLGRRRLKPFVEGAGAAHAYMLHVGAGWALARLRRDPSRTLRNFDPLLGWLAVDGYGFHEGYFKWPAYVARQERPRRLSGYARRAFDQGLGRSLWFVEGADVEGVADAVAAFERERHSDLWSGVGLACAYAGGTGQAGLEHLRARAGCFAPQLAQGAAFAAKARSRAGNITAHTEDACRVLCAMNAVAAAEVTDAALRLLPRGCEEPAYETWRRRIAEEMALAKVPAARHRASAEASTTPVEASTASA